MGDFKINVKALAKMQNISLKELADKAGINYTHLWGVAYKGVKLTIDDANKLSKATNVPIEHLC